MEAFHCESAALGLPEGHRFPATKYTRLYDAVQAADLPGLRLRDAPPATRATLSAIHDPAYVGRVFDGRLSAAEIAAIGFPWSPALVTRSRRSVGATLAASGAAYREGIAVSLAGGTHHADYASGAGFCVFNDVAVAAVEFRRKNPDGRVLVVDCDVHQGEGTARLLAAQPGVYTFSIHAARNFPHRKAVSDLDIGLADNADDDTYLDALAHGLRHAFNVACPQLVLYIAGADIFAGDRLGRLAVSIAAIGRRDGLVFDSCERNNIALAVVMGGGYAREIEQTVAIHTTTVALAFASWARRVKGVTALGSGCG